MIEEHDQDQRHKYHHLTRPFHMTLKMTTAQVVETSVTTNNNSLPGYYSHPDDHNQHTVYTPGFKPFAMIEELYHSNILII